MENNKKKLDPLDEALKVLMLSDNSGVNKLFSPSEQLKYITSTNYSIELSEENSKKMIDQLYNNLSGDSLGTLIEQSISNSKLNASELAVKANLPEDSIEQLKNDGVFANSIPVMSLKNLLNELKIPFAKAEQAILKSFHLLKSDIEFSPSSISDLRLTYRRKNSKINSKSKSSKSDNQYLFENEEALAKYLKRLNELL